MTFSKKGFTNQQVAPKMPKEPKPKGMVAIKTQSKPAVKPGNGTAPKAYGTKVKTK